MRNPLLSAWTAVWLAPRLPAPIGPVLAASPRVFTRHVEHHEYDGLIRWRWSTRSLRRVDPETRAVLVALARVPKGPEDIAVREWFVVPAREVRHRIEVERYDSDDPDRRRGCWLDPYRMPPLSA